MILAAQVFNSAGLNFKTEVFAVLATIGWTYLLHEYYERKNIAIIEPDGRSLLLSKMIKRRDSPLSEGIKNNLEALKSIRDEVEHLLLGKSDLKWQGLYQACCLNFEKTITELFGEQLSLANELSFESDFPWNSDGYKPATAPSETIDGIVYDGRTPNAYIDSLKIGLKSAQHIENAEIVGG